MNKLCKSRKQSISYCYEGYAKKLVARKQHITIFQNEIYEKKLFHTNGALCTLNSYLNAKSLANLKMGNNSTRKNRRLKSTRANLNSLATSNNCDDSSTEENNNQMVVTKTAMVSFIGRALYSL